MALLSFVDSTPRAYRLKVSNAAPSISTSDGTFPDVDLRGHVLDAFGDQMLVAVTARAGNSNSKH
jgi:hypothetical protein